MHVNYFVFCKYVHSLIVTVLLECINQMFVIMANDFAVPVLYLYCVAGYCGLGDVANCITGCAWICTGRTRQENWSCKLNICISNLCHIPYVLSVLSMYINCSTSYAWKHIS